MPNEVNIYTPRYLAEVVRLAPPVFTFFRDTLALPATGSCLESISSIKFR